MKYLVFSHACATYVTMLSPGAIMKKFHSAHGNNMLKLELDFMKSNLVFNTIYSLHFFSDTESVLKGLTGNAAFM